MAIMTLEIDSPHVRTPQQARSMETLRRFVDAAGRLLEESTFEALTITELAREAGASVGAFYNRFEDKESFLDFLDELYAREAVVAIQEHVNSARRGSASLEETIGDLLELLVEFHSRRRGLVRALVLRARARLEPSYVERTKRMRERAGELLELILDHEDEIDHPDPEYAVRLGFGVTFHALRELILFPETTDLGVETEPRRLVRELTHLFLAYLSRSASPSKRGDLS